MSGIRANLERHVEARTRLEAELKARVEAEERARRVYDLERKIAAAHATIVETGGSLIVLMMGTL